MDVFNPKLFANALPEVLKDFPHVSSEGLCAVFRVRRHAHRSWMRLAYARESKNEGASRS